MSSDGELDTIFRYRILGALFHDGSRSPGVADAGPGLDAIAFFDAITLGTNSP